MASDFLLYGANGFVGEATARLAAQQAPKPILAGRNASRIQALATELGLPCRVFGLDDPAAVDKSLQDVAVVLNCAGPFIHTYKPMSEACLRTGTHYLDITGEIPVFAALAGRDADAKARKVMLLPGVGFDVVPTDCLSLHLKGRLPAATHLALAWSSRGPARGFPPGTANTILESARRGIGIQIRQRGQLQTVPPGKWRMVDFGDGPKKVFLWPWADVFTAFYSTGIPNIEDYAVASDQMIKSFGLLATLRPLLRFAAVRNWLKSKMPIGSTAQQRAKTRTFVWGEVEDDQGHKAVSRLSGPEAGVNWTSLTALAAVRKVLAGHAPPGFQTPAMAYGADFVLETEGVTREDIS